MTIRAQAYDNGGHCQALKRGLHRHFAINGEVCRLSLGLAFRGTSMREASEKQARQIQQSRKQTARPQAARSRCARSKAATAGGAAKKPERAGVIPTADTPDDVPVDRAQPAAGEAVAGDGMPISGSARRSSASCRTCCSPTRSTCRSSKTFVAMYNDLMLGAERAVEARARDDRGRGVVAEPLLLLPGLAWRGGAAVFRQSAARRADRDELSRGADSTSASARCSTSRSSSPPQPWSVEEADRERLRRAGFSERDIWDIAAVTGFFNMSNRVASATDMRPNVAYHAQAR